MSDIRRWAAALSWTVGCGLLAAPALAAPPARAGGIQGTVTGVVDGDSVIVTPAGGGKPIEVRLAGIDAPEICQEFGAESKKYLSDLVLKQPVRLVMGGTEGNANDAQGRTLGTVYLADAEVNRRLVEEGMAWSVRIKWDQGPYVPQERMAKALSRGVHRVGAAAITPKDFRQRHGPCP
jgi:micrococcal nuclease